MNESEEESTTRPPSGKVRKRGPTDDAFAQATADLETIFREGERLDRAGKLDTAAVRHIEVQLQAIANRLEQQVAEFGKRRMQAAQRWQTAWKYVVVGVTVLACVGAALEIVLGARFICRYGSVYRSLLPLLFVLTLPCIGIWFMRADSRRYAVPHRSLPGILRRFALIPSFVVLASTLVVIAPLGWTAFAGWLFGRTAPPYAATVVALDAPRSRALWCELPAQLAMGGVRTDICLDERLRGPLPQAGDSVTVGGRRSIFGLLIDEIRLASPP